MGDVHLVIDGKAMAALLSAAGPVGQHLITRAEQFKVAARAQAAKNRRTGCMDGSILKRPVVDAGGALSITVISDTSPCSPDHKSYSLYVHEGTKPHDIPNAFGWGINFGIGENLPVPREFFHPGTPANRFLSDNLAIFVMA
jgi:hypothetical protein